MFPSTKIRIKKYTANRISVGCIKPMKGCMNYTSWCDLVLLFLDQ
jgi:hypothetical protein